VIDSKSRETLKRCEVRETLLYLPSPQEDGTRQHLLFLWDGELVEALFARM
jgi:hypothetical protein